MTDVSERALALSNYRMALVLLRTFLGIVYLSNGLAKLFEFHTIFIGPWKSNLINKGDAFGIQSGNTSTSPGLIHDLGTLVVSNWAVFQWLLTLGEIAIGLGLLVGLFGRLTALGGLSLALSTFVFTFGADTWTYDYLFEPVIFIALLIAPALPGLDSRVAWRKSASRR
ncbi:MAG: DoxX family membrane protein [Chloroflexota bacterium]|nr:DoxX family membrane protein [Chloroflexota bacterium]